MMKNGLSAALILLTAALAFSDPALPPGAAGVDVVGAVSNPGSWTVERIKSKLADQIRPVEFISHGDKHTASAVPLLAVLKASGLAPDLKMDPKADPKTKNLPLRMVVVVQGSDGYTVAFSLAELLGDIGAKDVWVCLDTDGKPLPDHDGPVRLIVPSDAMPGRWVHAVAKITVIDPTAPTTRPAPL
jgi:DMSO/TMAO reductase YedYZ molybdopterin-dependent catalytic subunit